MKSYPRVRPNCSFIRLSKKRHDFHYFFLLSFFFFCTRYRPSSAPLRLRKSVRFHASKQTVIRISRETNDVDRTSAISERSWIWKNFYQYSKWNEISYTFVWIVILLFRSFILDIDYDCLN